MKRLAGFGCLVMLALAGCGDKGGETVPKTDEAQGGTEGASAPASGGELPVFTHAPSEYPSWSTYMLAAKAGLINGARGGEHGKLEKEYGVDVELLVKDYDACLSLYGSGTCDAVCITNMDALNPALGRASTAILPTSTSVGGDKVISTQFSKPDELSGQKVYGLAKSVSHFVVQEALVDKGVNVEFVNLDPAAASTAIQSGGGEVKNVCIWNPFAMTVLKSAQNAKEVTSSAAIPERIIDMVVIGNDSLQKPGGDKFAELLCAVYYEVAEITGDPATAKPEALKALAEDFAKDFTVEDMKKVVTDTRFYKTPAEGVALFSGEQFPKTMEGVVETCKKIGVLESKVPTIGYGDGSKQLNFDTKYMKAVAGK